MKKKMNKVSKIQTWIHDNVKNENRRYRLLHIYWKVNDFFFRAKRLIPCTYLCCKYPFLKTNKHFFQTSCWYYCIDAGWRKAFGIQLCDELKAALKRNNCLKNYHITDVKEKYGELMIYDDGAPEEVHDIINKYSYISLRTCIVCGRRAKYVTTGWIEPYCEDCINTVSSLITNKPDEYYKDMDWYGWKK